MADLMVDPAGHVLVERGDGMREPDEVAAMLRLHRLGWGVRRIAMELGCSHMTVRRYLAAGGWVPYRSRARSSALDGLDGWPHPLTDRLRVGTTGQFIVRRV